MDKDNKEEIDNNEQHIQASLDGIADMAHHMGHPSGTMEIIGIATPEEAEKLQQQVSDNNNVITLPDKQVQR